MLGTILREIMMSFYGQYTGFGGGGGDEQNFHQDLVDLDLTSNLRLVFDAGSSKSYDGSSQTWTNLVTAEEDAWRGANDSATTDDPTFNGTSGNLSSSEYFSYDGGDHHRLKSSPTWLDSFHKNNA